MNITILFSLTVLISVSIIITKVTGETDYLSFIYAEPDSINATINTVILRDAKDGGVNVTTSDIYNIIDTQSKVLDELIKRYKFQVENALTDMDLRSIQVEIHNQNGDTMEEFHVISPDDPKVLSALSNALTPANLSNPACEPHLHMAFLNQMLIPSFFSIHAHFHWHEHC